MWSRNPTPGICQGKSVVQKDTCTPCSWASLVAEIAKNPSAMQETWVRSLGWEDPLEKGKNTGYPLQYFLAWRIPWTEEPGRLQSIGSQRIRHNWATSTTERKDMTWFWVSSPPSQTSLDRLSFLCSPFQACHKELVASWHALIRFNGLAQKFVHVFPYDVMEKSEWVFLPT